MKIDIEPGKYVLAVSGGVDSMTLLKILSEKKGVELIVAHFDHGIREDSYLDAALVRQEAEKLKLPFELGEGRLGKTASEDQARQARYKFLEEIRKKYKAKAIITAHQQDDVIETAIINIIRGTGPKGLASLTSRPGLLRPLLNINKADIKKYAIRHKVIWHEDSTNEDQSYLRNYVRKNVVPKISESQKRAILDNVEKIRQLQVRKAAAVAKISEKVKKDEAIDRQLFALLPSEVGSELIVNWMRDFGHRSFDKKTIDRANMLLRTALPNTKHDMSKNLEIIVDKLSARFK